MLVNPLALYRLIPDAQVLFNPRDIGLDQAGVAESVVHAVQAVHPAFAPLLYTNVILTGNWV